MLKSPVQHGMGRNFFNSLRLYGPPSLKAVLDNLVWLVPQPVWMLGDPIFKRIEDDILSVDPELMNRLPLMGVIVGILILRPLQGGSLLIRGLHYPKP